MAAVQDKADPKVWGPHVWGAIDAFVQGYGDHPDVRLRVAASQFFESLGELLPCPKCRSHYRALLRTRPIHGALKDSNALREWVAWAKGEVGMAVNGQRLAESGVVVLRNNPGVSRRKLPKRARLGTKITLKPKGSKIGPDGHARAGIRYHRPCACGRDGGGRQI